MAVLVERNTRDLQVDASARPVVEQIPLDSCLRSLGLEEHR
jgi:hypothetical protein